MNSTLIAISCVFYDKINLSQQAAINIRELYFASKLVGEYTGNIA